MRINIKKIFYILFFTILIAKAFPDEFDFYINPEIATVELGIDLIRDESSSPYWKLNLLNIHFLLEAYDDSNTGSNNFDIEITPVIISKYWDIPSYNFSFVSFKISYFHEAFPYVIRPFFGINYLNIKEGIFNFNTNYLQTGVRIGFLTYYGIDLCFLETGYAYKNNRHNWFFSIGTSPFWIVNLYRRNN